VTDTIANWEATYDHCANVLLNKKVDGESETRTYALWSIAGTNTTTHYRAAGSPSVPAIFGAKIMSEEFEIANQADPTCSGTIDHSTNENSNENNENEAEETCDKACKTAQLI